MSPSSKVLLRLTAAASVLALGACTTVGPDFKRPAPPTGPVAAGYAMKGDAPAPGVALSPEARTAGPWWQAFGSPELDTTIRQALAGSPTLAEAVATLERARAQARAVAGEQQPQVDIDGSAQRERFNIQALGFSGIPNPTVNLFSVGGSVDYDLDLFGGKRRATEEARARAETEERRTDAAYLTLSGNVALQAMRIASLRAQIAAVEDVIADDRQVLDMVRRAERAGGEAPSAITSGEAQLAEDEALLPPLRRDLNAARHQLALLVGKAPAEWTAPEFDLARLTRPTAIPVSLPSDLVRSRPDILMAEAELHARTAAVGVAVANQYPSISLTGNFAQTATKLDSLSRYGSSGWAIGPTLSFPVFHGGTLKAERRAAEAEARAALARYDQTVLRAFVQVSDVLAALGTDEQAVAALRRATAASEANAKNAQTAYRLGGGTLLQVTDAQRQFSRSRRALIQAEGQRFADLVQLYAATATDWRVAAAPPATT
ncbi:efflux transporter outer membrane subunit [Phenylobacterium sp. LjRoot219]|uniref:efflux transporter outer membrane subunit n=1 Tax=Phenylobacterium sp. LjRoot219 TaxID=3342283 RepID=UPI003ECC855E